MTRPLSGGDQIAAGVFDENHRLLREQNSCRRGRGRLGLDRQLAGRAAPTVMVGLVLAVLLPSVRSLVVKV